MSICKQTMKMLKLSFTIIILLTLSGCKKSISNLENITIPNGDFEQWDNNQNLLIWQTNSCPLCVPPWETYIVQKATDAAHGQFAAKFIYNNIYSSFSINKFAISFHPSGLTAYIKSNIINGDTATLHVDLFSGKNIVDGGNWYETTTTNNYRKLEIPITQTNPKADSALITILGGKKIGTEFFIDNLAFIK
jgi:hypothetical protein